MQSAPASQLYTVAIDSHNRIQNIVQDADTNTISILDTVPQIESAKTDPYNSTNNVAIPTTAPQKQIVELTMSSINITKTQSTIESLWNRVFISEQIEFLVSDESKLARTQFSLELSDGGSVTAQLPAYLNPITSVTATPNAGLTDLLITTQFPHALNLADLWNWGDPIRLVSIGVVGAAAILNSSNAHLSIVSSNQFQLSGLGPADIVGTFPVDGSGFFGYVLAPGIPGPVYLAQIVSTALNLELDEYASANGVLVSHVRIYYDLQQGQFVFVVEALKISPTQDIVDPVAIGEGFQSNPTLAFIMGFGNCCIANTRQLQNQILIANDRGHPSLIQKELPRSGALRATFGPLFRTFLDLDIGDYDSPNSLGFDVEMNWNRFWFDPSCTVQTQTTYRFVFTDACGVCYVFLVPFGLYTPEQFAQFLQTQMNLATGTNIYQVSYNTQTCRFTFSTTNGAVFGVKFGDTPFIVFNPQNDLKESIPVQIYQVPPQFTTVAVRMGFDNVDYRGLASYTSIRPVCVPKKQLVCSETTTPVRRFQFVAQWRVDGSSIRLVQRRRFAVYAFTPTLNGATLSLSGGQLLITTPLANGFQVNDVVKVTIASGVSFYLRIISLVDPFNAIADVNADILAALGVTPGPVTACVENAALPIINLYLSQNLYNSNLKSETPAMAACTSGVPCNSNPNNFSGNGLIAPRILGFGAEDVLWEAAIGFPFVGLADVVLNYPDSILILIGFDNGDVCYTHTSHLWKFAPQGQDVKTVLAIVQNHSHHTLTWERFVPNTIHLASPTKVGAFKFVILNPDHTLYQLHNQDWSGSLNLQVVQASGQLLST